MKAISATFHNFGKPNLQRKTFSFMMEVPIEQTQKVVEFFGSPTTEESPWFSVIAQDSIEELAADITQEDNNAA